MLKIRFEDTRTGQSREMGPYPFVQLTYALLRVGQCDGDALPVAEYERGEWFVFPRQHVERWHAGYTDVVIFPAE